MSGTRTPLSPAGLGAVGPKAKAVIAAINQVRIKSSDADSAAKTVVADNVANLFPVVFSGMTSVVSEVSQCTFLLSGMSPGFSAAEQDEIYEAFEEFVHIHGEFIATVVGKQDLVPPSPSSTGVASAFLAGKLFIDSFASKVTALVPTRADDAKSQHESLGRSLLHATNLFRL